MEIEKRELVFIPSPSQGHIVSTLKLAERLLLNITNPNQLSITILTIKPPLPTPQIDRYISSLPSTFPSLKFLQLPHVDPPPLKSTPIEAFISLNIQNHKPLIKAALTQLNSAGRLAGLVIDFFFTTLIDVGTDLEIPTFIFFASNAAMLGFMLHLPILDAEFGDSGFTESIRVPSFANSVPSKVLPSAILNNRNEAYKWFLYHGRRFREAKGILVNTFGELERHAIESLAGGEAPKVYAIGPIIDVEGKRQSQSQSQSQSSKSVELKRSYDYKKWLDKQPEGSVVLLCFGSRGGFTDPMQVREVAAGLERSGHRFLWVLRRAHAAVGGDGVEEVGEGLPEGFEGRMEGRGVVCEWVDQVGVLEHRAIGGFVSHCGWNSILESLWFGVPIATWPMYAEQQLNAFYMVREKGLAVEMRLDYRLGGVGVVTVEEVERGVNEVMEKESEVRKRVEEMSKRSRDAIGEDGSSLASLRQFVQDMVSNYKV